MLLFGGIETTEGMIANAILHVLEHPEQRPLVERDPGLVGAAVEESLRLEPAAAVSTATRRAPSSSAAPGSAERELVTVSLAGANRDPAVFAEPDRFDLTRDNARLHVTFAQGPHVCIGMHLARLEAQVALRASARAAARRAARSGAAERPSRARLPEAADVVGVLGLTVRA